ncbi:TLC domain-containing protein 2-like [Liolophura sinensis]|uniref:TLC domain-containing protein 2-like n=1 Tax=Liolophura sinensis TaxID=3198878 RepID=UPI0031585AAB
MSTQSNSSRSAMADKSEEIILGEAVEIRYGIFGIILSILFFQLLNRVAMALGSPKVLAQHDEWKWRNLAISWFHALICATWDLSCFVFFPEMFQDLVTYANYYIYSMVAFSSGYFVYDFIDMWINNKLLKLWEVTLHHIAVAGMFIYNILVRTSIAYTCVALLAEVNSFFLHSRKLLQMMQVDFNHWFYKLTAYTNLVTFVVFRGLSVFGILYGMYLYRTRVSLFYYVPLGGSMVVMSVMNPILFYRLLKNDVLRNSNSKEYSKVNHVNNVNNNIKHEKAL